MINGHNVPMTAKLIPIVIRLHETSFCTLVKVYNLLKHNSGNTIDTVNENVLPKIDMIRSKPGTRMETHNTRELIKILDINTDQIDPNFDFIQSSSSIFNGCIVRGYLVSGFKAISQIVPRLIKECGKESVISSSTSFPNIKYPETAIRIYVNVVKIYVRLTILG